MRGIDDDFSEEGDVSKELEKMRELLEDLKEYGKKMDIEMEFIDYFINLDFEIYRRNLFVKFFELCKEMRDVGGKIRIYKELMSIFVNLEFILRFKVEEDIKVLREVVFLVD